MTERTAFMCPIEIQNSTAYYQINYQLNGGGTTSVNISPGVYSSLQALLYALSDAASDAGALNQNVTWTLRDYTDTYGFVSCRVDTVGSYKVTAGSELNKIIGDYGNNMNDSYSTYHESGYQSSHLWVSKFSNASQTRWHRKASEMGFGSLSKTGYCVGNSTGPIIYYRGFRFTNELSYKIYEEAARNTYESQYSFESMVNRAMWSSPEESGNPSTRGVFVWPNLQDAIDNPDYVPGGTDGATSIYEGVNYDLTSDPDLFTFCEFDLVDLPAQAQHPSGKVYYEIPEFEMHTIESMPTWESPTQP